jgi:hypothetical protein
MLQEEENLHGRRLPIMYPGASEMQVSWYCFILTVYLWHVCWCEMNIWRFPTCQKFHFEHCDHSIPLLVFRLLGPYKLFECTKSDLMYISCVGILGRNGESKGSTKGLANWIDTGPNRTVRFLCINIQGSTLACIWPQCCTIPHKKSVSCIFSFNKCRANKGSISHGPGNGILIFPVFRSTIWHFCCFTWEPSFQFVLF